MATVDGTWTYSYDNAGELIHAALASTNPDVPSQDLTYQYNAAAPHADDRQWPDEYLHKQ